MKKKLLFVFLGLAVVIGGILFFVFIFPQLGLPEHPEDFDSEGLAITKMTVTYPIDIYLYGDPLPFREKMGVKEINKIEKTVLTTDITKYKRTILIINSLYDNALLSQDDITCIKELIVEGKLDFYYVGDTQKNELISAEILDKGYEQSDYLLMTNVVNGGKRVAVFGLLGKKEKERVTKEVFETMAESSITLNIGDNIDSNN